MRGTEPASSRLLGRGSRLRPLVDRRGGRPGMDWVKDVDSQLWMAAIIGCLDAGVGVLLSRTSDGGAVSITIYEGDERSRSYAVTADELTELLAAVRDRASSHSQ